MVDAEGPSARPAKDGGGSTAAAFAALTRHSDATTITTATAAAVNATSSPAGQFTAYRASTGGGGTLSTSSLEHPPSGGDAKRQTVGQGLFAMLMGGGAARGVQAGPAMRDGSVASGAEGGGARDAAGLDLAARR